MFIERESDGRIRRLRRHGMGGKLDLAGGHRPHSIRRGDGPMKIAARSEGEEEHAVKC
jgi:hypothetical protein